MARGVLFVLIFILGSPSARAVTDFVASKPDSDCASALLPDPFYKLVSLSLSEGLITLEQIAALSASDNGRNPLQSLPKKNVALLMGIEKELRTMSAQRWARLRPQLAALSVRSQEMQSARAEARTNTALLLDMRPVGRPFELRGVDLNLTEWFAQGDKVVAVVRSTEPNGVLYENGRIQVVNLQGRDRGIGLATGTSWHYGWKNGDAHLIKPETLEEYRLAVGDVGGFEVGGQYYIFNAKDKGVIPTALRARRLGQSHWRPFQAKVKIEGFIQQLIGAIGGAKDGYLLSTYKKSGSEWDFFRFNGREFTPVAIPMVPGVQHSNASLERGQDEALYVLGRYYLEEGGSPRLILYKIRDGKLLDTQDFGREIEYGIQAQFWRGEQGQLGLQLRKEKELILHFLEADGPVEYRATLPPGFMRREIGIFQFGGTYAAVFYDLDGKILIQDMITGTIAASFDLKVDFNHKGFSLFPTASGQVYLLVQSRYGVRLYTLTTDPTRK